MRMVLQDVNFKNPVWLVLVNLDEVKRKGYG